MSKLLLLITPILFLTNACSSGSNSSKGDQNKEYDIEIPSVPTTIKFNAGIPSSQVAAMKESISFIHTLNENYTSSSRTKLMKKMKLANLSPLTLQNWLEQRVGYVIEDGFTLDERTLDVEPGAKYPNENLIPNTDSSELLNDKDLSEEKGQVMMSNVGTAVYLIGKRNKMLVKVNLGSLGIIPLTSPRTGLLKVGPGLFPNLNGSKVQNILLDGMRAETLFHEARHSDGHGKTLGFLHAKCPSDHDYAGMPACDLSTNGPYTIGALMFKYIMDSTADKSTEKTKKIQQLIYLDIANRTLPTSSLIQSPETAAGTDWDDAPEMLEKN